MHPGEQAAERAADHLRRVLGAEDTAQPERFELVHDLLRRLGE
jgi:hypothetical protein